MALALEGSNAAMLGPLNLHRVRERTKGEQDHHHENGYHHGNGNESGRKNPRPSSRPRTSQPRAHPPPAAPAQRQHRRTGGQTDTERREEAATPGPRETPGQHRRQESRRATATDTDTESIRPGWNLHQPPQDEKQEKQQGTPGESASPYFPSFESSNGPIEARTPQEG